MAPEQEALYALQWNVPRRELSMAGQLEYDRLRPAWERGDARPAAGEVEAARLAWDRAHPSADERRGSLLVTGPGRYARPVTGDKIRETMFLTGYRGYDMAQVDDLLRRAAEELDAGRSAEPLIKSAVFRIGKTGYDKGAVDWFLGQLLSQPGAAELAELSSDPWRDLDVVASLSRSWVADLARRSGGHWRTPDQYYARQCRDAWHDFDKQPGTYLRMGWVGINRRELLAMDVRTIASMRSPTSVIWGSPQGLDITVSTGGKSFALRKMSTARSSSLDVREIAARMSQDFQGHFAAKTTGSQKPEAPGLRELVDETGTPILYRSGSHFNQGAHATISFPGQRWLRFPVRGIRRREAIMTAVDEAGNSVFRYRIIPPGFIFRRNIVQIAVHPDWMLTDELVLAIAISASWISSYFASAGG